MENKNISPDTAEWATYLKEQMDTWPEWKRAVSSYSYDPLSPVKPACNKSRN